MVPHVEVHIFTSLTDKEWKTLRVFCEKAKRLAQTKLMAGGESHIHGSIKFEAGKGLWFEATLPPEEQIAEFLMAFRFFYLQKEPTCYLKVLSLLGKHTAQNEAKQALKTFKNQWEGALFKKALQISLNNKPVTASVLMDLWFNAHYFHTDEAKGTELEKLTNTFSESFAKYMLLDGAYEATRLVFKVYDGVHGIVEAKFSNP
jgi:hypothetical protein